MEVWLGIIIDKLAHILYAVHVSLAELMHHLPFLVCKLGNGLEPLEIGDGRDIMRVLGGHRGQRLC